VWKIGKAEEGTCCEWASWKERSLFGQRLHRATGSRKDLLKILVLIKGVYDAKVPLAHEESTGRLRNELNVLMVNPADRSAIRCALRTKELTPGTRITLAHLGPPSGEAFLREGLAMGCDEALRIWDDDEIGDPHPQAKALIFSRLARTVPYDLILTGACSQDTANGQLGVLLASMLGIPCVTCATFFTTTGQGVAVTKQLSDGSLQHVESSTPLVVTMESVDESTEPPAFPALVNAAEEAIPCLDLADIGVPKGAALDADSLLAFGPLRPPASRLRYIPAPDSSLPAYERRMQLLEGSMKKRQGRIVEGTEDEVVEALFRTLLDEGWLE
jgi:electron transfer flavoprotein beta subunit